MSTVQAIKGDAPSHVVARSAVMLSPLLATELAELHPRQCEAAIHDGNLVVLAGPGAGKTRTLVARVGYLLAAISQRRGVAAITFTDAAARAATARLLSLGMSPGRRLASHTVHAFCLRHILRPYGSLAGTPLPHDFQVLDSAESERLWEHAFAQAKIPLSRRGVRGELPIVTQIRRRAAAGVDISDFSSQYRHAVAEYERCLHERGMLDFDEMTHRALHVLRNSKTARELLVARFPHLVVDEYQDLSPVLHRLVTVLLDAGATVTAVGDPDQTMFEFQGADPRYLRELTRRKDFTAIRLTLNYRSGSALVAAGRAALGADRGYTHDPQRTDPGVIEISEVSGDLDAHAERAAHVVTDLLGRGVPVEDIAVLYPGPTDLHQQIQAALAAGTIPFDSERARRTPDGPLADWVSACTARRLSGPLPGADAGPASQPSGIVRRPAGGGRAPSTLRELAATLQRLRNDAGLAAPDDHVRSTAKALLAVLDAPDREKPSSDAGSFLRALSDVAGLQQLAAASRDLRDQQATSILEGIRAEGMTMAELAGGRAPGRVVLTTYHSAKGREFSAVVLPGLVEGLVPFYFANQGITAPELERARRLFYVAVTRAIDAVVLIPGTHFTAWGRIRVSAWSQFVGDIRQEIGSS